MLEKQQRIEKHLDTRNRRKEALATLSLKAHEKEGQRRRLLNRDVAVDYYSQGWNAATQEETKTQSQPLSFPALHLLLVLHRGWTRLEAGRWGSLGDTLCVGETSVAQSRAENGSGGQQMESG